MKNLIFCLTICCFLLAACGQSASTNDTQQTNTSTNTDASNNRLATNKTSNTDGTANIDEQANATTDELANDGTAPHESDGIAEATAAATEGEVGDDGDTSVDTDAAVAAAKEKLTEKKDAAKKGLKDKAKDAANKTKDAANNAAEKTKAAAEKIGEKTKTTSNNIVNQVKENTPPTNKPSITPSPAAPSTPNLPTTNNTLIGNATNTINNAANQTTETAINTGNTVKETVIKNTPTPPAKPTAPISPPKPVVDETKVFFASADAFFKQHVANGKVAYSSIKGNSGTLDKLVKTIGALNVDRKDSKTKQAFYINAYNILVIKSIIANNIPSSPLDVKGFFNTLKHQVSGKSMTLDYLEKTVLFGVKKDPRFHFAVVCAAVGCPRIENFAYTPAKLDGQLTKQTKHAVNNADFTKVNNKKKKVYLSKIFEWYKADFEASGSLLDFVNKYRDSKIPNKYKVDFYDYNWKVNKQ